MASKDDLLPVVRDWALNFNGVTPLQVAHATTETTELAVPAASRALPCPSASASTSTCACSSSYHHILPRAVLQMIEKTERITAWALFDRDPVPQWSFGRVTLLGDAAHPLLPFGSQGASQVTPPTPIRAQLYPADQSGISRDPFPNPSPPHRNASLPFDTSTGCPGLRGPARSLPGCNRRCVGRRRGDHSPSPQVGCHRGSQGV